MRHYRRPYHKLTACGLRSSTFDLETPSNSNCEYCKNTEIFKEDLYEFEIGCDGSIDAWTETHKNKNPGKSDHQF